jgi:hypothetical protein
MCVTHFLFKEGLLIVLKYGIANGSFRHHNESMLENSKFISTFNGVTLPFLWEP